MHLYLQHEVYLIKEQIGKVSSTNNSHRETSLRERSCLSGVCFRRKIEGQLSRFFLLLKSTKYYLVIDKGSFGWHGGSVITTIIYQACSGSESTTSPNLVASTPHRVWKFSLIRRGKIMQK